jgi:TraC-like protein
MAQTKGKGGMKKPSSRIREEIAALQEQLRAAETREAERIGRLALKAGIGDIEIDDGDLVAAFEEVAGKFRKGTGRSNRSPSPTVASGASQGTSGEA